MSTVYTVTPDEVQYIFSKTSLGKQVTYSFGSQDKIGLDDSKPENEWAIDILMEYRTKKIKVGSLVQINNPSQLQLACGSGRYNDAVVISIKPLILISREGDTIWQTTFKNNENAQFFSVTGEADRDTLINVIKRLTSEMIDPR